MPRREATSGAAVARGSLGLQPAGPRKEQARNWAGGRQVELPVGSRAYTAQTNSPKSAMDFGFYKRARGIKHKTAAATPFYPGRKPAPAAPAQQPACSKAKQPTAAKVRSVPAATPPSMVVAMEERFRRERMADDWRKYY
ncbi:hypothetical protein C2845_PM16G05750 [Panicum miliaceum]|uniref:Uncharacterized protein n=1 Tax=Panicum miliaceum TaxID=4540 RepID=A0A3L6PWR4_PANMI|nr:hypothetical protein C2845_PM16G05750 [Panicum miliaceum]